MMFKVENICSQRGVLSSISGQGVRDISGRRVEVVQVSDVSRQGVKSELRAEVRPGNAEGLVQPPGGGQLHNKHQVLAQLKMFTIQYILFYKVKAIPSWRVACRGTVPGLTSEFEANLCNK